MSDELARLIMTIATTARIIARQVSDGALGETLGTNVMENVQGEVQKKLDVISNNLLIDALLNQGRHRS